MKNIESVELVIDRIRRDVIGGAVDTAKEVINAFNDHVTQSKAQDVAQLFEELDHVTTSIMQVTPSFAPPINALHWMMNSIEQSMSKGLGIDEAKMELHATHDEFLRKIDTALTDIASIGAELINENDTVFMFSMSSTIWKVFLEAKRQGKNFTVLVTEARPGNEGLWSVDILAKAGIPVEVSIDACMAEYIKRSNLAFAGVDAVAADGSVFNKVGTYLAALAARDNNVPFYFVTDTLKFDTSTLLGLPFRSDPVQFHEIFEDPNQPSEVKVSGKLFDTTPAHLITGIITELGPIHPAACVNVIWNSRISENVNSKIKRWALGTL
jgi:translation initiation factor 2B subunit (eIF-2B alpha/beta/delta family)